MNLDARILETDVDSHVANPIQAANVRPIRWPHIRQTSHKRDNAHTYKSNTEARSRNYCCRGKAISITHSECVSVALVIQDAKRMRRIISSPAV